MGHYSANVLSEQKSSVTLRGRSEQAKDRLSTLREAKQERERRKYEKALPLAALVIQKHYRACKDREQSRQTFYICLIEEFGHKAKAGTRLSIQDIIYRLLPLCYAVHMPPWGVNMDALMQGAVLQIGSLIRFVPGPGETDRRLFENGSIPDYGSLVYTLSLVLKGLTRQKDAQHESDLVGDCGMFSEMAVLQDEDDLDRFISDLVHCLKKLVILCCAVMGVPMPSRTSERGDCKDNDTCSHGLDLATQCAAARIVELLADEKCILYCKEFKLKNGVQSSCIRAREQLIAWWKNLPMACCAAIRGLSCYHLLSFDKRFASVDPSKLRMLQNSISSYIGSQIEIALFRKDGKDVFGEQDAQSADSVVVGYMVSHALTVTGLVGILQPKTIAMMASESYFWRLSEQIRRHTIDCSEPSDLISLAANYTGIVYYSCGKQDKNVLKGYIKEYYCSVYPIFDKVMDNCRQDMKIQDSSSLIDFYSCKQVLDTMHSSLGIRDTSRLYSHIIRLIKDNRSIICSVAFNEAFLRDAWSRIAMNLTIPATMAKSSTASVHTQKQEKGIHSVKQDDLHTLFVFGAAYDEYLKIADDHEIFHRQKVFSLDHQRAIAALCNRLAFRTLIPLNYERRCIEEKPIAGNLDSRLYNDILLCMGCIASSLFEKNSRHSYCEEEVWLSPYNETKMCLKNSKNGLLWSAETEEQKVGVNSVTGILGVLKLIPYAIPFNERVQYFQRLVWSNKTGLGYTQRNSMIRLQVHRNRVLEDILQQVGNNWRLFRKPISVTFINDQGPEAGIDIGGLTKELLDVSMSLICDPQRGVFASTSENSSLFPSPLSEVSEECQILLEMAGAIVGKAMYEGLLLNFPLSPFFIAKLQGKIPNMDDLQLLDPQLYHSIQSIKQFDADTIQSLGLYFTVEMDILGELVEEELVPGGRDIPVTEDNKIRYIHLLSDWHLRKRMVASSAAFAKGLQGVIAIQWLQIFSPAEINRLLGGGPMGLIDVNDIKRHTIYKGGYTSSSRSIKLFWSVMEKLDDKSIRSVLRFITGTEAAPLGGFEHLNPPFTIQMVDSDVGFFKSYLKGSSRRDRLPTASTCFNTLRLPPYQRESILREKLLYAVNSNSGFELS